MSKILFFILTLLAISISQSNGESSSSSSSSSSSLSSSEGGERRRGSNKLIVPSSTTVSSIESLIEEVEEKEEKLKKEERREERNREGERREERNREGERRESNGEEDEERKTTKDPKKANFQEERFTNLFHSRSRSRSRLPPVRYTTRVKPTLPSFIRNTPSLRPVTFPPTYIQRTGERSNAGTETGRSSSRSGRLSDPRLRTTSSTTTTPKPTTASNRRSRQRSDPVPAPIVPISDTRSRGRFTSITPRNSTRSTLARGRNIQKTLT